VNVDGETGRIVPPARPAALADAMAELAGDPGLAARMGEAARVRYEQNFTGDAMAERYLELYEAVLANHGKA
jgi:rhamnosyl/mannosyltransferase